MSLSLVFFIFYKFLYLISTLINKKFPGTFIALQYHEVRARQKIRFSCQMNVLARITKPVFADFSGLLKSGKHYSSVTFDDGFRCVVENALPELYKRRIPATLFIPTKFLGKKPLWEKNTSNTEKNDNDAVINVGQLLHLPAQFVMIGSHCHSHKKLIDLSIENVKKELLESKLRLEGILKKKIKLLAFPYGVYNNKILQLSKCVGYERSFSSIPTFPSYNINKYLVGRIYVSPDDWPLEFKLKIRGAYQWLPYGILIKRKLKNLIFHII